MHFLLTSMFSYVTKIESSKSGSQHWHVTITESSDTFTFCLIFQKCPISKRIHLRVLSCFSFSFLLSVPDCGPVPQSSLYFHYLDTFEDYKPITLYCVLWYAFVSCFPIIRLKLFILSRISQRWCCVHAIGWYSLIFSLWSLEWDDACHIASPLQLFFLRF